MAMASAIVSYGRLVFCSFYYALDISSPKILSLPSQKSAKTEVKKFRLTKIEKNRKATTYIHTLS